MAKSISVNDSRTKVTEVFLAKCSTAGSNNMAVWYRVKGHSSPKEFNKSYDYEDLVTERDDKFYAKRSDGYNEYFVIGVNGLWSGGQENSGFTKVKTNNDNNKVDDTDNDDTNVGTSSSDESSNSGSGGTNKNDIDFAKVFDSKYVKFFFTVIPVLPLWWLIKLPFKAGWWGIKALGYIISFPFRLILCCCCTTKLLPEDNKILPEYSFVKF